MINKITIILGCALLIGIGLVCASTDRDTDDQTCRSVAPLPAGDVSFVCIEQTPCVCNGQTPCPELPEGKTYATCASIPTCVASGSEEISGVTEASYNCTGTLPE